MHTKYSMLDSLQYRSRYLALAIPLFNEQSASMPEARGRAASMSGIIFETLTTKFSNSEYIPTCTCKHMNRQIRPTLTNP